MRWSTAWPQGSELRGTSSMGCQPGVFALRWAAGHGSVPPRASQEEPGILSAQEQRPRTEGTQKEAEGAWDDADVRPKGGAPGKWVPGARTPDCPVPRLQETHTDGEQQGTPSGDENMVNKRDV